MGDRGIYQPEVLGSFFISPLVETTVKSPEDNPVELRLCTGLTGELALAGRGLGLGPVGPVTNLESGRLAAWSTDEFAVGSDIFGLTSCFFGGVSLLSPGLGAFAPLGRTFSFSENGNIF